MFILVLFDTIIHLFDFLLTERHIFTLYINVIIPIIQNLRNYIFVIFVHLFFEKITQLLLLAINKLVQRLLLFKYFHILAQNF